MKEAAAGNSPITPSSSLSNSFDWDDENASWRTRFSSIDEFEYPSTNDEGNGGSDYLWKKHDLRATRSISSLSVMTAEPIDYDCSKEVDFKPSEVSFSQEECSSSSMTSLTPKQLLPGNPNLAGGDCKNHRRRPRAIVPPNLVEVESFIHQMRLQKDPPSYYHLMEMNPGPIDYAPRLSNVPSQYQLQDMYEFSALQNSAALAKFQDSSYPCSNHPRGQIHEVDSQYYTEV